MTGQCLLVSIMLSSLSLPTASPVTGWSRQALCLFSNTMLSTGQVFSDQGAYLSPPYHAIPYNSIHDRIADQSPYPALYPTNNMLGYLLGKEIGQ